MKLKYAFAKILYEVLAKKLPSSHGKWNTFSYTLRNWCIKNICNRVGYGISIGREAIIHKNVILGNNSGVGSKSELRGTINIGNNVLMASEVIIWLS